MGNKNSVEAAPETILGGGRWKLSLKTQQNLESAYVCIYTQVSYEQLTDHALEEKVILKTICWTFSILCNPCNYF